MASLEQIIEARDWLDEDKRALTVLVKRSKITVGDLREFDDSMVNQWLEANLASSNDPQPIDAGKFSRIHWLTIGYCL